MSKAIQWDLGQVNEQHTPKSQKQLAKTMWGAICNFLHKLCEREKVKNTSCYYISYNLTTK